MVARAGNASGSARRLLRTRRETRLGKGKAAMGFEPMNNGFAIRPEDSQESPQCVTPQSLSENGSDSATDHWPTHWHKILADHAELANVLDTWATLPEPVRVGILAMVRAAVPGKP